VLVAGELFSYSSMLGQGKQHLIAEPIIGLVIDIIGQYLLIYINEQPLLEEFNYVTVNLNSGISKIEKIT
tara:strand:- start:77 stop:286 length:210 start_codon:yes stop_codon:yes gene_type:complete